MRTRAFAVLTVLILASFGIAANAQQPDGQPPVYADPQVNGQPPVNVQPQPGAPQTTPPQSDTDQGAGRVSFIHGDVSMLRGDTGESSAVTLNTPLMAGDKISTGDASRTEIQLDFANVLRLDERAQVNVVTLNRSHIQLQLAQGLISYSAVRPSEADVEIDTPNVSIHPQRQGRYRIQVNANGDTEVVVRDGEADVATTQGSTQVRKGELITIQGSTDQAQYRVTNAPANDEWDSFNDGRDGTIANAQSFQHTSPYYTGGQDLDQYGVWSEVPDYGQVWIPSAAPGWAPYRAGRWVYEPYWGWTWVSYEPWGWAPYHYGRWFLYGSRWAWWPGPAYVGYRPLWAPAYVSFFGFGGGVGIGFGFGLGFGFGNVGWLAIGPGDFFHPWWGGFRGGFGAVDIHNFYNARGGFAPLHSGGFSNFRDLATNDRLRAGMSSVSSRGFGAGTEPVRGVSAENLRDARGINGGMPISPSRTSMRASDRPGNSQAFAAHANQHFFSTNAAGGARGFQGQAAGGFNRAAAPASQQGAWQRFSGNAAAGGNARASQPSYRPPLSMNRPIVNENQRAYGGANGGFRGGYPVTPGDRGAPSGNAGANRGGSPAYRGSPAPGYRPSSPAPSRAPSGGSSRGGGNIRGGGGASRGGSSRGGGGGHRR